MKQFEEVDEDEKEKVIFSLDDLDNLPEEFDEEQEIDEEADAFSSIAPPPAGIYAFLIQLGDNGIQLKENKIGKKYASADIIFVLQSDDSNVHGATCKQTLSSNVSRGRTTSTLATFLNKNGMGVKGQVSVKSQALALKKLITSEKLTYLAVDWEAGYMDENGRYIPTNKGMKSFPKNKDGSYKFRFEKTVKGQLIEWGARLKVKDFLGSSPKGNPLNGSKGVTVSSISEIAGKSVEDLEGEI